MLIPELRQAGWAAPAWPVAYGSCDRSVTQHYIFSRIRAKMFTRQRFPYHASCGASTDGKHPPHLRRFRAADDAPDIGSPTWTSNMLWRSLFRFGQSSGPQRYVPDFLLAEKVRPGGPYAVVNAMTESEVCVGIPGDIKPARLIELVTIVVRRQ
jgi:hypothetical protein